MSDKFPSGARGVLTACALLWGAMIGAAHSQAAPKLAAAAKTAFTLTSPDISNRGTIALAETQLLGLYGR
jgi:hypothetical protein